VETCLSNQAGWAVSAMGRLEWTGTWKSAFITFDNNLRELCQGAQVTAFGHQWRPKCEGTVGNQFLVKALKGKSVFLNMGLNCQNLTKKHCSWAKVWRRKFVK
jgi:hypothetical protein